MQKKDLELCSMTSEPSSCPGIWKQMKLTGPALPQPCVRHDAASEVASCQNTGRPFGGTTGRSALAIAHDGAR
jgi:hypothetical protein